LAAFLQTRRFRREILVEQITPPANRK